MRWNERAFIRKWQLAVIIFALFLVAGVSLAGVIRAFQVQHETQQNRVQSIEDLCGHDNANARHNVEFLEFDVQAKPALVAKARSRFKQTKDCHAFALKTVRPKPNEVP